jgi:hypothetical protein
VDDGETDKDDKEIVTNYMDHEAGCALLVSCFSGSAVQRGLWPPRTTRFRDHIRRATVGRTPLDE